MPFGGALTAIGASMAGAAVSGAMSDSGGGASTTQAPTMTKQQKALLRSLIENLQPKVAELTKMPEAYTDPFAAPLSNLQKLSLSSIENMVNEMGSNTTYLQANKTLQDLMASQGEDITGVFQDSVVAPYTKQFQEQIMPSVIGNFGGMGAYGSDRMKAQQTAMGNLNDTILSKGSELSYNAKNAANQNKLAAAGLVPNVMQTPLNMLINALGAAKIEQDTAQQQVSGKYTDFLNQQTQRNTILSALLQSLGMKGFENITTVGGGMGPLSADAIGGLGDFASKIFGLEGKDRRFSASAAPIGSNDLSGDSSFATV